MFGNMGNMGKLMKQAQEMQERLAKVQDEIAAMECTGESGAGLVKVTINGAKHVVSSSTIAYLAQMPIRKCAKT